MMARWKVSLCPIFACLISCRMDVSEPPKTVGGTSVDVAQSLWCKIDPPSLGDASDWVKIPPRSIHIVRAQMQEVAKSSLGKDLFVELINGIASPYLRKGETISGHAQIYLIRSAAFYVSKNYELGQKVDGKIPIDAYYSPARKLMAIVHVALAQRGTLPSNLALIVESPGPISATSAACLVAE